MGNPISMEWLRMMKASLSGLAIIIFGYLGYLYLSFDTVDSCKAVERQLVQRILDEKAVEKPKSFLTSSLIRSIAEVPAELFVEEKTGANQVKCVQRLLTGGFQPRDLFN